MECKHEITMTGFMTFNESAKLRDGVGRAIANPVTVCWECGKVMTHDIFK